MTTTFEKWSGTQRGNYCTLPTKDVEIVELEKYCVRCGVLLRWNPKGFHGWGEWEHAYPALCTYSEAPLTCRYCGCNDPNLVKYRQMSYSDETHCARCGGVSGHGIGD